MTDNVERFKHELDTINARIDRLERVTGQAGRPLDECDLCGGTHYHNAKPCPKCDGADEWRILDPGETLEPGDQWQDVCGELHNSCRVGQTVDRGDPPYRRRVGKPAEPECDCDDGVRTVEMWNPDGKFRTFCHKCERGRERNRQEDPKTAPSDRLR